MKPLLVSSGEPTGVGPDLCLALAGSQLPIVVLCDKTIITERAKQLGQQIILVDYQQDTLLVTAPHHLTVLSQPCETTVVPGELNIQHAPYVMNMLTTAAKRCKQGEFSALVTAPINKAVLNQAGIRFTGHTEFFADYFEVEHVVMMLACDAMKVALVTTHLPLRQVAEAVTESLIIEVITRLHQCLQTDFGIQRPRICVAGLNPHAGEAGYLGNEENEVISPALSLLRKQGIDAKGPFSADTMFVGKNAQNFDAFVAMYHDQGLPVLKYAGFGHAVNVTLGLPIIRTSVDHGTALELAGTGKAETGSLLAAVEMAASIAKRRERQHDNH